MRTLLDTGPLVALLNRRDAFHAWAVEQAARLTPPLFTCEPVLAEAFFLLSSVPSGRERLMALLETDRVEVSFSYAAHRDRVHQLMRQYADLPASLADACLVCMAEQQERTVLTLDSHFRIYRIHRNEAIHAISP